MKLTHLNANYQTIDLNGDELLIQRFNYQYAIFSTSGFSENAIRLAIAYKITLIDLGGSEYYDLLHIIDEIAQNLLDWMKAHRISLNEVREYIRRILFNERLIGNGNEEEKYELLENILGPFFKVIEEYGDLYLASINSPFSILIKPSSPDLFRSFIGNVRKSTFEVRIHWYDDEPEMWEIRLDDNRFDELILKFYLPELIKQYVFNRPNVLLNALNAKEQFFGSMIFYMRSAEKFITFKYRTYDVR